MTYNLRGMISMTPMRPHASVGLIRTMALAGATIIVLASDAAQAAGDGHTHGHHHPSTEHDHGAGHGHAGHFAFGRPGDASEVDRTIEIEANDDMMFHVSSIDVKNGETIRFIIRNVGEIVHDFTIGTPDVQAAHEREMKQMMEAGTSHGHMHGAMPEHDDPNAVIVHPGETKELIWTFTEIDNLEFGCNVPGHYGAGMKGAFNFVSHEPGHS